MLVSTRLSRAAVNGHILSKSPPRTLVEGGLFLFFGSPRYWGVTPQTR
jgi:hypothetical protein